MSSLAFVVRKRCVWALDICIVKLIIRRKKALPGCTTEQAKFSTHIKDCISFNVHLFVSRNFSSKSLHLINLSSGKRASCFGISKVIHTKSITCEGSSVRTSHMGFFINMLYFLLFYNIIYCCTYYISKFWFVFCWLYILILQQTFKKIYQF